MVNDLWQRIECFASLGDSFSAKKGSESDLVLTQLVFLIHHFFFLEGTLFPLKTLLPSNKFLLAKEKSIGFWVLQQTLIKDQNCFEPEIVSCTNQTSNDLEQLKEKENHLDHLNKTSAI